MNDPTAIINSLKVVYARLESLRSMEGLGLLLPDKQDHYQKILEEAYAALYHLETEFDELGQELEAEHQRLDEAIENYGMK